MWEEIKEHKKKYLLLLLLFIVCVIIYFIGEEFRDMEPYHVLNDLDERLQVGQTWNQDDLFEVQVKSIKQIPIEEAGLSQDDLQKCKEENRKVVDVIFDVKNLNYDGIYIDNDPPEMDTYTEGMLCDISVYYDEDGGRSYSTPAVDEDRYFNDIGLRKGEIAKDNRFRVLLYKDVNQIGVSIIIPAEKEDGVYQKYFEGTVE